MRHARTGLAAAMAALCACGGSDLAVEGSPFGAFSPVEAVHAFERCANTVYTDRWVLTDKAGLGAALRAGKIEGGATQLEMALVCWNCVCEAPPCEPVPSPDAQGRIAVAPAAIAGESVALVTSRKLDAACGAVETLQAQGGWVKTFTPPYSDAYPQDESWVTFELQFATGTIRGTARVPPMVFIDANGSCLEPETPAPQGCAP